MKRKDTIEDFKEGILRPKFINETGSIDRALCVSLLMFSPNVSLGMAQFWRSGFRCATFSEFPFLTFIKKKSGAGTYILNVN